MGSFKLVVLLCLVAATAASGPFGNCQPGPNDLLLDDIPLINVVVGRQQVNRSYRGYKLTCVRCTRGLLNILGELLNISVLEGGKDCDHVLLQVNVGNLGARCRVYGKKLKDDETLNC
ncbi:uncharacterized protein LOC100123341 [Nasonia vitripennis]|uniref:Uncharacterized protein n=1 Tax=Nasonia vitripennis TaxID=7425 RepID=A0A7M7TA68_NASVI|nr:uncharacterized protein LOC100123341 [Nasonia vitripennis]